MKPTALKPNDELEALSDEHRQWLSQYHPQYKSNWEKLCAADYEAAMTEAGIRRLLRRHGITVEPNEKLTDTCGGPDFRCSVGKAHFYVEVTCIAIDTAERKSDIELGPQEFSPFNSMGMAEAVFAECQNKAPQCANLDGPALVAVGTFHGMAAMIGFDKVSVNCLLTGKTKMAWDINRQTGEQNEIYQVTELKTAAFLRPDKSEVVGFARSSVSGILLCAVGLGSMRTIGVLHPNPARPFNMALLPGIEFGQVKIDRPSNQLHVHWQRGSDD